MPGMSLDHQRVEVKPKNVYIDYIKQYYLNELHLFNYYYLNT